MHDEKEAELFGKYIVGSVPSPEVIARYKTIVKTSTQHLDEKERTVISFVHRYPRLLPAIDAYLAIFEPHHELRRRLFFMFAILEATPKYADKFLPKDNGPSYWLTVIGVSLRALSRLISGAVIMSFIGAKR